jgi:hypothetical protein
MSSRPIVASQVITVPQTGFQFTAPPLAVFEEQKYTVVGITTDQSGSIYGVRGDLFAMNEAIDRDLKAGAGKHTIIVRRTAFTDNFPNNVREQHGFLPALAVDPTNHFPVVNSYGEYGGTPLADGVMETILAAKEQAMQLINIQGVPLVNLALAFLTDGGETGSRFKPADIKAAIEQILAEGEIESIVTILVGVDCSENTTEGKRTRQKLETFQQQAGLTKFIPFDEMTPGAFGQVARVISQTFTSTSQALGSGGPSKFVQGLQSGATGGGLSA